MKKTFSGISVIRNSNDIVFRGRFCIKARFDNFYIQIAPLLELTFPINYPSVLPKVRDVDDVIDYDHKFQDGYLCVATIIDLKLKLNNSLCISDYIDKFLIPYFISYKYWEKNKEDIYGDRSHGVDGVIETLQDFFNILPKDTKLLLFLIAWASKSIKFRKNVPKSERKKIKNKYASKIGEIRKTGLVRLRVLFKLIIKCLKNPSKNLYEDKEYLRLYNLACS